MVAFVLNDPGVEALGDPFDRRAVQIDTAVADATEARHRAGQPGNRQAALPALVGRAIQHLDHRIDQRGQSDRPARRAFRCVRIRRPRHRYVEDDDTQGHVHLRCRKPYPRRVGHRLGHVGD